MSIGGLIVFAIVVLCLERMLRIFEVVSNSANPGTDATAMIVNLLPHYLGMAVPMALLLGVLMTVDRFSRTSELTAALGAGISLFHMTKPFIVIAVLLAGMNLFVEGYMQPVGRYNYRQVFHMVKQQSVTAALREGIFTSVGNRTFHAGADSSEGAIGPIFIYERIYKDDQFSGIRVTAAEKGELTVREKTDVPVLRLAEGQSYKILENRQLDEDFRFDGMAVAYTATGKPFRVRGDDEREMTTLELLSNRKGEKFEQVSVPVNNAALHLRLGRAVLLLLLPFIAVPFGLNYGRNPSSAGIFIGIVMLVSLQKALEFGQSMGASGAIPPWAGIWPTIFAVGVFAAYIFWKSAYKMGQPPLTSIAFQMGVFTEYLKSQLGRIRRLTLGPA